MVYYVDNINGSLEADGTSPIAPAADYKALPLSGGDSVLFKRGSVYRNSLSLTAGDVGNPITYGAYGEGDMPTFTGGTDVSLAEDWIPTERENVWLCVRPTRGCVGNMVYNSDECTAILRWTMDGLCTQGDFFDELFVENCFRQKLPDPTPVSRHLYMYSVGNPATVYNGIVAVDYGEHNLCVLKDNVIIDGLKFKNSSVHAIAGGGAKNVTVSNCIFENVGGCVWNYELRIRFGNAVEFWDIAENVLVEKCSFKNVYDSCVTHQGPGAKTRPAVNFNVRKCRFENYGMAAFEYRDKLPISSAFTENVCIGAGVGFATADGEVPRRSEIWPQPMGHHIFLWRIDEATEGGSLLIENNTFGVAPHGAAIYSIISDAAEAQMTLKNNRYTRNDALLVRFGGENYTDLDTYKQQCSQDEGSVYYD